ncbi:MAG: hypothetical protein AAFQ80_21415 [Cyanobacteria bacterium J06621_8]
MKFAELASRSIMSFLFLTSIFGSINSVKAKEIHGFSEGRYKHYKVYLESGEYKIKVSFSNEPNESGDPHLLIYNSENENIGFSNKSDDVNSLNGYLDTGTYYIRVYMSRCKGFSEKHGSYSITGMLVALEQSHDSKPGCSVDLRLFNNDREIFPSLVLDKEDYLTAEEARTLYNQPNPAAEALGNIFLDSLFGGGGGNEKYGDNPNTVTGCDHNEYVVNGRCELDPTWRGY